MVTRSYRLLAWNRALERWVPFGPAFGDGREDWRDVREAARWFPGSVIAYL
jgi:hypothetical protein